MIIWNNFDKYPLYKNTFRLLRNISSSQKIEKNEYLIKCVGNMSFF